MHPHPLYYTVIHYLAFGLVSLRGVRHVCAGLQQLADMLLPSAPFSKQLLMQACTVTASMTASG